MATTQEPARELEGAIDDEGRVQAFAFRMAGSRYAIGIDDVLSISQLEDELIELPCAVSGYRGLAVHRGDPVPVLDLAGHFGVHSMATENLQVAAALEGHLPAHVAWVQALEDAVEKDIPFGKALDPTQCAFGQWLATPQANGPAVVEAIRQMHRPHRELHALAGEILGLAEKDRAEALERLHLAKLLRLGLLQTTFARIIARIRENCRQVHVYVTRDGVRPVMALLIEEIEDLVTYWPEDFLTRDQAGLPSRDVHAHVKGMLVGRDGVEDALLLDVHSLAQSLEEVEDEAPASA